MVYFLCYTWLSYRGLQTLCQPIHLDLGKDYIPPFFDIGLTYQYDNYNQTKQGIYPYTLILMNCCYHYHLWHNGSVVCFEKLKHCILCMRSRQIVIGVIGIGTEVFYAAVIAVFTQKYEEVTTNILVVTHIAYGVQPWCCWVPNSLNRFNDYGISFCRRSVKLSGMYFTCCLFYEIGPWISHYISYFPLVYEHSPLP